MRRAAAAAVASVLLAAAAVPARAADTASGGFQCNAEKIPIRGAVARWEPAGRELRVMLFKAPPAPEPVAFWRKQAGQGGTAYDPSMGYFAAVTAALRREGRLRMNARGDEKMGMQSPTHITWDVSVDAPVHSK